MKGGIKLHWQADIEPSIVEMVLGVSKMRQSLKRNHRIDQPKDKLGKVGHNYIKAFLKDGVIFSNPRRHKDLNLTGANEQGIPISDTCMIALRMHYLPVD